MYKKTQRRVLATSIAMLFAAPSLYAAQANYPDSYNQLVEAASKQGKVIVYATTDTKAAAPLVSAFEKKYPSIKVEYHDMNSTELYNRFISEQASGAHSADVIWSSAMDAAMQLATQYAAHYDSPETAALPDWASWQQRAYGTTFEPTAFIYNKRLIEEKELPKTHDELAQLVSSQTDRFKNKVTTYDIEKSAVGYMLAAQDSIQNEKYLDFIKGVGAANLVLQSSTGTMMERVSSGENLFGYNILGSYAETRARTDSSIGVLYPTDYTLVLSRIAFISEKAKNPDASRVFLDFMLSQAGQNILANESDLASIRNDVDGDNDLDGMEKKLGKAITPIPVNDSLLEFLKQKERLAFINDWRAAANK